MKASRCFVRIPSPTGGLLLFLSAAWLARMAAAGLPSKDLCGIVPEEEGELSRKGHGHLQVSEKILWAGPAFFMHGSPVFSPWLHPIATTTERYRARCSGLLANLLIRLTVHTKVNRIKAARRRKNHSPRA